MKLKHYLMLMGFLAVGTLAMMNILKDRKISRLESEIEASHALSLQTQIETQYVPAQLDALTSDELSEMGGVMWGD